MPELLSIFLTLQTVLKLMMLSTDGDEGENSAGKKKKKKKKKKGCKMFFTPSYISAVCNRSFFGIIVTFISFILIETAPPCHNIYHHGCTSDFMDRLTVS